MPKYDACGICAEENKGKHACEVCGFSSCRACLQRYTLDRQDGVPTCPNCYTNWSDEESKSHLTATFVKGPLRKRKRDVMMQDEYGRLRETLPAARKTFFTRQEMQLRSQLARILHAMHTDPSDESLRKVQRLRLELETVRARIEEATVATRVVRCAHEGCGHFVDATSGICMACHNTTCVRCLAPCNDSSSSPHVCDPNTVASLEEVHRECRPCAGCSAMTHRVEGCPVMWCAHCHVFWNWDTGEIIHTRGRHAPHNPEHRNWLAASSTAGGGGGGTLLPPPREVGDVPCGGVPSQREVYEAALRLFFGNEDLQQLTLEGMFPNSYEDWNRCINSLQFLLAARTAVENAHRVVRPMYAAAGTPRANLCMDLRIKYLLKDVTKEEFEAKVEQRMKKVEFQHRIGPIAEMFTFAGIDVLLRFMHDCETVAQLDSLLMELRSLQDITNQALEEASRLSGGRKVPHITPTWQWKLPYRSTLL